MKGRICPVPPLDDDDKAIVAACVLALLAAPAVLIAVAGIVGWLAQVIFGETI